jgi:hypothetical protein
MLHAAQMKATWGWQRQRTFALTDHHEILASAEQYRPDRHVRRMGGAHLRHRIGAE